MEHQEVCAVILAAGSSNRMGKMKQLLQLGDKCILEQVIDKVVKQTFNQILVVIGHNAEVIKGSIELQDDRVQWLINDKFQHGLSTSFLSAISHINPSVDSVTFFLGDQPFVKDETIAQILNKGRQRKKADCSPFVVRPYFGNRPGHPIFWGNYKKLDFSCLSGDEGAKSLLRFVKHELLHVEDSNILFDIDTPVDYKNALQKIKL